MVAEGPARMAQRRDVDRLRVMVDEHIDAIARVLRRLGVPDGDVDDGVQQVFLTASRRMDEIAERAERAFLYKTALHVAAHARRTVARRREAADDEGTRALVDAAPSAEDLIDRRRAAQMLEQVLGGMAEDLRTVFVLFEVEQLSIPEIAALIDVPAGTAASRLRRAREDFSERVARLRARQAHASSVPGVSARTRRGGTP